ncbi:hypothetical protein [Sphingomonas sp. Ant20]|uniref:hypothetical protein n=1 Tax=Sphingomonas sp. Ant20 TaxID=104605 RepID=UPI002740C00C|nr:hypothetical protein [Sphingomonas sp. Ant20]
MSRWDTRTSPPAAIRSKRQSRGANTGGSARTDRMTFSIVASPRFTIFSSRMTGTSF